MTVYLGTFGQVTLQRKSTEDGMYSVVNPSDVNPGRKRFSFDFETGFLITGDQVEITSTDGAVLDFVDETGWSDSTKRSSGKWFVYVDELGGIRLFATFAHALGGEAANAIALDASTIDIPIRVVVANAIPRILGTVTGYELNTNRETIDITALSEQFRSNWSGLMSGSGRISCRWDYKNINNAYETPHYLMQLALRTEVGSEFSAELYIKTNLYNPSGQAETANDQIWYAIDGIITGAAVQFTPDSTVEMTADFVTTGRIQLLTATSATDKILQEDTGKIRLDQDPTASLVQDDFS
jgi:hypothetical protein